MSTSSRRKALALGPEAVVEAGLHVLDEVGLAAFSMRAVADRLGTYPATLYWHVGNRATLLAAVLDRVLSEMSTMLEHKFNIRHITVQLERNSRRAREPEHF